MFILNSGKDRRHQRLNPSRRGKTRSIVFSTLATSFVAAVFGLPAENADGGIITFSFPSGGGEFSVDTDKSYGRHSHAEAYALQGGPSDGEFSASVSGMEDNPYANSLFSFSASAVSPVSGGLGAAASIVGNSGYADASAEATAGEVLILNLKNADVAFPYGGSGVIPVDATWSLEGSMAASGYGSSDTDYGAAKVDVYHNIRSRDLYQPSHDQYDVWSQSSTPDPTDNPWPGAIGIMDTLYMEPLWESVDGSLQSVPQFDGQLPEFGMIWWVETLGVVAEIYGSGTSSSINDIAVATSDFANTSTLSSLTLPDGLTMEQHGMELYFASGRLSPNGSTAVSEPASLVLCGIGMAVLIICTWRRRWRLVNNVDLCSPI